MTRALVTFAFVLFCAISVFVLGVSALASVAFGPVGIFLILLWAVVAMPFVGALVVVWLPNERPRFSPSDIYLPPKRNYQIWNSINGWPRDEKLFYECGICHNSLLSTTSEITTCSCGNVFIGPDHIGAQNPSKVRLYEEPA